jgi:hypothetical protein
VTRVSSLRPRRAAALLAAGLLAATLVVAPVQIYRAAALDFASASRDLLLAVFGAGLLVFAALALGVLLLPARARSGVGPLLVAVAAYAWTRSGFFPGPSVNLDGTAVTADLTTGAAGLLVPVAVGLLLGVLGVRRPRAAASLLAVLLAGSLAQSLATAASAWRSTPPASRSDAASLREWSRSGNVLVVILDSMQSDVFGEALQVEPRLRGELEGFRFYRLASSSSPTTYLSLPTIHGGRAYEPGKSVRDFYREAVYEGSVLNRFAAAGYRTSYAVGIGECPKAVDDCTATAELARSRADVVAGEATRLLDLGVYRVLPDALRAVVLRGGRGPVAFVAHREVAGRAVGEAAALEWLASASTVIDAPPTAKVIHSMVTHPPAVLQADCSAGEWRLDREGARLQVQCALRRVVSLLERLRKDGVYDLSTIVILADHGYGFESSYATESEDPSFRRMVGSFNPTVLVKRPFARGALAVSDAPIELADVTRALCSAGECSPAEGLRRLDEVDPARSRPAFSYTWNHAYWGLSEVPGLVRYSIRGDLATAGSWSRAATAYTPGTAIQFRRGGKVGEYVGFGWGHRQKTHTWMVDPEATLWLKGSFEPGRDHVLIVEAQAPEGTAAEPKAISVQVNGVEVGRIAGTDLVPAFATYRFTVPTGVLARSAETVVRFSARSGPGEDPRSPTARLAVRTLELRASR